MKPQKPGSMVGAIGPSYLPWLYLEYSTLVWNERKRQEESRKSEAFINSILA